ncbi:MAG TPA: CDP-alcohol phosphatidyltransferase family protein [Tepidisphaeraceae bacterium]|nr:CDP-alcohol phosphatidyltransferase family protein [Tepidisphaeraceae bacterium]
MTQTNATTTSTLVDADRRPIAVRRFPVFNWMAGRLARAGISANAISVSSTIFAIAAGISLAMTAHVNDPWWRLLFLTSAGLIQLRLLANLLDGMVAIEHGGASPVGMLYNEVPDRISDAAILIGAGYAIGGDPILGYLAACAALFTAYVRAMGKVAGANQEFCGPMAKQQRMATVTLVAIYLGLTPTSLQPTWHARGLMSLGLAIVFIGSVITSIRRLLRVSRTLDHSSS